MSARSWFPKLISLLLISTLVSLAKAQTTFASLEGTVTDQSEGRVPGVSITVTNTETNISRAAMTDDRGFYRVSNLPVGIYDVRAEFHGFAPVVESGVSL